MNSFSGRFVGTSKKLDYPHTRDGIYGRIACGIGWTDLFKQAVLMSLIAMLTLGFHGIASAQQNFANDMRNAGASASIVTLPTEIGKLETYFVNIKNNDIVRSPFRVVFGLIGMGIAPAGFQKEGTGHHHLLIDSPLPLDLSKPIPFSATYRHYGGGQTEAVLELPPGKHTLQLLFADQDHTPMFKTKNSSKIVVHSRKITIYVAGRDELTVSSNMSSHR